MTDRSPVDRARSLVAGLDRGRPVHLSGIAGSAMIGLARILAQRGFRVRGTDPRADGIGEVVPEGVEVFVEQDGSRIDPETQLLIATAAIPPDHPEIRAAREAGVPVSKYAEVLGALMGEGSGIAVAGTHGKTTTAAMIVAALRGCGEDPSFAIGGFVPGFGAGAHFGRSSEFVAEACEYDRSFLNLTPRLAVITNIDADHFDVYPDMSALVGAFSEFSSLVSPEGAIFFSPDDRNAAAALEGVGRRKVSVSLGGEAEYSAGEVRESAQGTRFVAMRRGDAIAEVSLSLPGRHNVSNALFAVAVGCEAGFSSEGLAEGLSGFSGVCRRFEMVGEVSGVTVIDDYAHHPTEVRALLSGASTRFPGRRLVVVFQPHQISRTRALMEEFSSSFTAADVVVVPDVYAAREPAESGTERASASLAALLRERGVDAEHVPDLERVTALLVTERLEPGDVLLTVGAGDVDRVARGVVEGLRGDAPERLRQPT